MRVWTVDDDIAARELGFRLRETGNGPSYVVWEKAAFSKNFGEAVDLYVMFLAIEGEPTAIKVLDIIGQNNPREHREMVRTYLAFTSTCKLT